MPKKNITKLTLCNGTMRTELQLNSAVGEMYVHKHTTEPEAQKALQLLVTKAIIAL